MLSLEVSHIYGDSTGLGDIQRESLIYASSILKEHGAENVHTSILIDDLHIDQFQLDIEGMVSEIAEHGIIVDRLVMESQLAPVAQTLIDQHLNPRYISWEQFRNGRSAQNLRIGERRIGLQGKNASESTFKHSCAILTAAWHLCRLGVMPFPEGSVTTLTDKPSDSTHAISILHDSFVQPEDRSKALMAFAGFKNELTRIHRIYYSF